MEIEELKKQIDEQNALIKQLRLDADSANEEAERMREHQRTLLDETKKAKADRKDALDTLKSMQDKVEDFENKGLIHDGNYEELLTRQTEKLKLDFESKLSESNSALDDITKKYDALNKQYASEKINGEIRKAAESANVIPAAIDDVIFRASGVFSIGDDGTIEARDSDGNLRKVGKKQLTPETFVESLKETATHLWPASQGAGASGAGGPRGASGPNPWAKETLNYTEQAKMIKSDPERAEMLRAQAQG